MQLIQKYFQLNAEQVQKFEKLFDLYTDWNSKINLISRKDIDNLEERHFLHSLSICKYTNFKAGTTILDLGCGGGFPGIMLAIIYPDVLFTLIDARNKKILVVKDIIEKLNLTNVLAIHGRAEEIKNQQFDFVVTRAVAKINQLKEWTQRLIKEEQRNILPNGIIALKGNLDEEIKLLKKSDYHEVVPIKEYYSEAFFEEKYLLYVQF